MVDSFRAKFPFTKKFTWRRAQEDNPKNQETRIDLLLVSKHTAMAEVSEDNNTVTHRANAFYTHFQRPQE